jgi:hypothetical protein
MRIMSYHPLEQGEQIKRSARLDRVIQMNTNTSPEQQNALKEAAKKDADILAEKIGMYTASRVPEWKGGRTRRLKKRRASRRAKKRTRRSKS